MQDKRFKTVSELERDGLASRKTILEWCKRSDFPSYRVGKIWKIDTVALQDWLFGIKND